MRPLLPRRRSGLVRTTAGIAAGLFLLLAGPAGCRRKAPDPGPDPFAPKEGEEDLPFTDDCRSWADLDPSTLPPLPESPHAAAFDQVWLKVAQHHYDPTLGCLDWPVLRERYGKKVAEAADAEAAYAQINEMLGTLRQSHLRAVPPATRKAAPVDSGPSGPALVPARLRIIGDEVVVMNDLRELAPAGVAADPDPAQGEAPAPIGGHVLPPGAVLVKVEKTSVADAVAEGRRQAVRPTEQTLHATREVAALLRCPVGGSKSITYRAPGTDEEVTESFDCVEPQGELITMGNLRNLPTQVHSRVLEGHPKVGYIAFNYWMVPMVPRIREGLTGLREAGIDRLIIDLRGNPGGVGAMAIPVGRLFLPHGGDLGRLHMRDSNVEFEIAADAGAFTGPIVVLVDEGTASTSEIFTAGMRDLGRIEVVGASPSAGLALPSVMETLPDGGLIQYVVGDYRSSKGSMPEGEGVQPDQVITLSRAALAEGRDPVLEAAIERIAGMEPPKLTPPEPAADTDG